ncbi:MmgE/PrpD family protein [Gordonia sp. NPDC003376]
MAADLRLEHVPRDVQEAALDCIVDTVAVTLAGADDPVPQAVAAALASTGSAVMIGGATMASPPDSALVNGIAAHVLDFDDWLPAARIHPSAALTAAALAAAHGEAARVSGQRLVAAYVAGFEIQARIGASLGPSHYDAGFHPTATIGVLGAATAASHISGASPVEMADAWGLAATSAAGLRAAFGTAAKSIQVGNAARNGVVAAQLARSGLSPLPIPVLDDRGFAASHGHAVDHSIATEPFESHWYLSEVAVKEHASCFGTHAPIDAVLALRDHLPINRIATIEVTVSEVMRTVCAIPVPMTALEGKFSLAFTTALAVVRGHCRVADFTDEAVQASDLREVSRKVRLHFDEDVSPQWARVQVTLDNGQVLRAEHDSAQPMPAHRRRQVARDKLAALASAGVRQSRAGEILTEIERLLTDGSVADLARVLTVNAP